MKKRLDKYIVTLYNISTINKKLKENEKMKMYRVIKHEEEYNKQGFEYEEFMNLSKDCDQYPEEIGRYKTKEEALNEISKHNTIIECTGQKVLVTEYYIEYSTINEDEFTLEGDGFDYIEGPDFDDLAPLAE